MSRAPRIRTMRQFAEQQIVLPDGPHRGSRFRVSRQPFSGLLLDAIDSGRWPTIAITGPSQTGKSLLGYVIPTMFHLFEMKENVVCGVTDMAMAADKWAQDFLPAIEASSYRDLLPRSGSGSRGGRTVEMIQFRHGPILKFMSSGGSDKSRAGFTSRVLALTETDGMDTARAASREADPIEQMMARLRSYGDSARVYKECTVSIERGHIWQAYTGGTASRIALPCPHCAAWVTPEREQLTGWQDAADEIVAAAEASLACPDCGATWCEAQRIDANRAGILVHRGQEITPEGRLVGDLPRTRTLGFRWTAANNLLAPIGVAGVDEWKAARSVNVDSAERKLRQFVWAVPTEPDDQEVVSLTVQGITERQGPTPQGLVPDWADVVTLGIDEGQHLFHWVLLAGDLERQRHIQIVDYGVQEVHSRQYQLDTALDMAIAEMTDFADVRGWPRAGNNNPVHPDLTWWDAGWMPIPTYRHCKGNPRHWPTKGQGLGQYGGARYHQPKTTGATTIAIYDGFHLAKIEHAEFGSTQIYELDANLSKSRVHDRLGMPTDQPGAMLLPSVPRAVEHLSFAHHLMAEQLVEVDGVQVFQPTPGMAKRNHWLDACGLALAAMMRRWSQPKPMQRRRSFPRITTPDGRPFVATHR